MDEEKAKNAFQLLYELYLKQNDVNAEVKPKKKVIKNEQEKISVN